MEPEIGQLLDQPLVRLACPGERRLEPLLPHLPGCERRVGYIYFLTALRRLGHVPQQNGASSAPPGFRRTRSRGRLLLKRAWLRDKTGDLAQRVRRLIGAFNQPERYIARVLKRLARGVCLSRLIITAPSVETIVRVALAPAHADSS